MRRRTHGVTLIELLVSVLILSIGLVGIVACLNAALITNMKANRIALATALAQYTLDDWRSNGNLYDDDVVTTLPFSQTKIFKDAYDDLNNQYDDEEIRDLMPNGQVTIKISDYNPPNDTSLDFRQMVATVSWQTTGSSTRSVSLTTVVSNRAKH